ncbi:helix-turn-helix transcriptional regulator, partial [Nonomuraea sp. SBT364]|uniref:helix-turn-helix transcriptional regulator n=1 Tax=Nonomuraea sp. SBT364 TaxID=1580530 RepID=UPI00069DD2C1
DGGALAVLGAPGIGKTAVLELAASLAGGFTVLRTRGVRQEAHLPMSGLDALLRPVADRVRSRVLARALRTGVAGGGVALPVALLEFLRELAAGEPVLVCVDDVHLLDRASREAVCFAARRLSGERIALLLTAPVAGPGPVSLPTPLSHPGSAPAFTPPTGRAPGATSPPFTGRTPGTDPTPPTGHDHGTDPEPLTGHVFGTNSEPPTGHVFGTNSEPRGGHDLRACSVSLGGHDLGAASPVGAFQVSMSSGVPDDVPALVVGPLDEAASRALAGELLPERASDELCACLVRVARGNPLGLRELAESLTAGQLAGLAPPPDSLPPRGRLHRAHAERLAGLPEETRTLLLLLAAAPGLDTATLLKAAEAPPSPRPAAGTAPPWSRPPVEAAHSWPPEPLDAPPARSADPLTVLAAAERAGVIRADGDRYVYADETVRAVAYAEAPLARRREVHRLLGTLLTGLPRAWHRAAALDGPPDELAADLAAAASTAVQTTPYDLAQHPTPLTWEPAAHPTPSLAYERAAQLSQDEASKAAWLAAAARHAWTSGDFPRARSLLAGLHRPVVTDEAELMYGRLELLSGHADSASAKLVAAAARLVERDRLVAVKALLHAAEASYMSGDIRTFHAIARQAALLRRSDDCQDTQLMFEYLEGIAATFSGRHRAAAGPLRRVVALAPAVRNPATLVWACVASLLLGEDATAIELSARAIDTARRRGAVSVVPQLLESLIQAEFWLGRYSSVAAHAADGLRLAQASGQLNSAARHLGWLAHAAAVQGDAQDCRDRAHAALDLAESHGLGIATSLGNWALAHLDLATGRPAEAAARLRGHHGNDHVVIRVMASPHFIEAAARTGDRRRASAALRVLDGWAGSTRSPDRRALVARCRALLATGGEAGELFREALELHTCPFETARTQLLYGVALRRERQPGAAREHLHGALETFQRLGAGLWSERARTELRASGEAVVHLAPAGGPERLLTAQQLRIARLVAEGATNREVAAQLFLSPRTIDHHLRNVFAKLGVRSRVELSRLLS